MTRDELKNNVINIVKTYEQQHTYIQDYQFQQIKKQVDQNFRLFGKSSKFDSLVLVNIIVDVQSLLLDNNIQISIMDSSAMSPLTSPFRTVGTLVDFIWRKIG